jgi:hypothetical protein
MNERMHERGVASTKGIVCHARSSQWDQARAHVTKSNHDESR